MSFSNRRTAQTFVVEATHLTVTLSNHPPSPLAHPWRAAASARSDGRTPTCADPRGTPIRNSKQQLSLRHDNNAQTTTTSTSGGTPSLLQHTPPAILSNASHTHRSVRTVGIRPVRISAARGTARLQVERTPPQRRDRPSCVAPFARSSPSQTKASRAGWAQRAGWLALLVSRLISIGRYAPVGRFLLGFMVDSVDGVLGRVHEVLGTVVGSWLLDALPLSRVPCVPQPGRAIYTHNMLCPNRSERATFLGGQSQASFCSDIPISLKFFQSHVPKELSTL